MARKNLATARRVLAEQLKEKKKQQQQKLLDQIISTAERNDDSSDVNNTCDDIDADATVTALLNVVDCPSSPLLMDNNAGVVDTIQLQLQQQQQQQPVPHRRPYADDEVAQTQRHTHHFDMMDCLYYWEAEVT